MRVDVYEALGRQVAVLADGEMVTGWHRVRLDGSTLPSGVYLVRMSAGSFRATERMMLVR